MALEDELLKELEGQAEPQAAWNASKEQVQKGTAVTRAKADYTAEAKGPGLVDREKQYAVDFYTGMGWVGNGDPDILRQNLRTALGHLGQQGYAQFSSALGRGDVDEANQLVKQALTAEIGTAKLQPTLDRIALAPSDTRLAWSRKAVERVGGTEYMRAATNPAQLAASLGELQQIAQRYK